MFNFIITRLYSVCFFVLTSTTVAAQTALPTAADLQGIVGLDFLFNPQAYSEYGAALSQNPASVSVTIGADGSISACDIYPATTQSTAAAQRLCEAIRLGHSRVAPWYAPYMQGGHVGLNLTASRGVVPVKPVRFVDIAQGEPTDLILFHGMCHVTKPPMAKADSDAVCAAFAAAGRPGLTGGPELQSARVGLTLAPSAFPYVPYTYPQIVDRGQRVEFSPAPSADLNMLSAGDGRIAVTFGESDYPARALRENLEGQVKVLLGFDRSGTAQSCRPLSSANSSYLGNVTCAWLVAKAHFAFVPSAPIFQGLRFNVATMRWLIPN